MDREGRGVRNGIAAAALTAALLVAGAARGAPPATATPTKTPTHTPTPTPTITPTPTPKDVLTIGTVTLSSGTGQVEVPIFIQDNTGTPIGRDMGATMRISGFAMQVTYGQNSCIDTPAVTTDRIDLTGGILASLSADFESRVKVANTSQSWIYALSEANGLIPFTAAAAPGDRIGAMVFNLTGCSFGTINLVVTKSGGAQEHADGNPDECADRDADQHADDHADDHADEYADEHADQYTNNYTDEYPDRHADQNADQDSDEHADRHTDDYTDE